MIRRQPKVHSVTLLVREKGTAKPFEPREYMTCIQHPERRVREVIRYAEARGMEVSRPH